MNWTNKKPIKEGWYWYKLDRQDKDPAIVYVLGSNVSWFDGSITNIKEETGLWYGPLEPPEEK